MKYVTGALRSQAVDVTIFRVQDVVADTLSFYGFANAMSDSDVTLAATSLQNSLLDPEAAQYSPYSEGDFEVRQGQIEEADDYEILDHLIELHEGLDTVQAIG